MFAKSFQNFTNPLGVIKQKHNKKRPQCDENRPKQTKVIERKLHFYFSNSDLDHRHLGSNPKLPLDISYLYSKFGVNKPKQTKVIERKLNFYF